MTPPALGEFERIERYFAPLARRSEMALDLKDDAALVTPLPGRDLVLTTDAMVAGRHFFAEDPPDLIARKLLRVNLSDLAAMGARPIGYLLATAWREDTSEDFIAAFAKGLAEDQETFDVALLGGDTVATDGPLNFTLTALGDVERGRALRRAGAAPGDRVYVSGTVGDAALGLMIREQKLAVSDPADAAALIGRHRLPEPRLALGRALIGLASAAIDVSDGLVADLAHLCAASAVGAAIEAEEVPLSPAAARALGQDEALLGRLLTGGDDYELCFTLPPAREAQALAAAAKVGVQIAAIGRIGAGSGVEVRNKDGRRLDLGAGGFRHF